MLRLAEYIATRRYAEEFAPGMSPCCHLPMFALENGVRHNKHEHQRSRAARLVSDGLIAIRREYMNPQLRWVM
jgi:hypothetical protein